LRFCLFFSFHLIQHAIFSFIVSNIVLSEETIIKIEIVTFIWDILNEKYKLISEDTLVNAIDLV